MVPWMNGGLFLSGKVLPDRQSEAHLAFDYKKDLWILSKGHCLPNDVPYLATSAMCQLFYLMMVSPAPCVEWMVSFCHRTCHIVLHWTLFLLRITGMLNHQADAKIHVLKMIAITSVGFEWWCRRRNLNNFPGLLSEKWLIFSYW